MQADSIVHIVFEIGIKILRGALVIWVVSWNCVVQEVGDLGPTGLSNLKKASTFDFIVSSYIFIMQPFLSASKTFARLFARNAGLGLVVNSARCRGGFGGVRYPSSVTGIEYPSVGHPIGKEKDLIIFHAKKSNFIQSRSFMGFRVGEECDALSKVHEEKRVIGYTAEQLFAVVAGVDLYEDFVPWCQRSKIILHKNDGSFDAELKIGFNFLVESYISHVELNKPKSIKSTVSKSSLFDHLINVWEFNPGPTPGTCDLHFLVDFKFQSPFYRQAASMFFKEVAAQLIGSFNNRCRLIYGPGVPCSKIHMDTEFSSKLLP